MAAVSKVPTEVLTEIFHLLCKKPILLRELNNSCCREDFPWAVGLVCRQWRTSFLSYPPIWASLKLSDGLFDASRMANLKTRNAKEMNRRLALYLERSGGYPLRLNIFLWTKLSKAFTIMALEMLSACSHRWRTAQFDLSYDWQVDSILPCKGKLPTLEWLDIKVPDLFKHNQGVFEVAPRLTHAYVESWEEHSWILPWTQLTELILRLDADSVIENDDILKLLPMLHNINELRLRFEYDDVDSGGDFPQYAPTPLNQLRVLEVPHPDILSWFEAPSLCEICIVDHYYLEEHPLDVHGEISSLIQRSSCSIRKLSFSSGRAFYIGTLGDVEELVIDYQHSDGIRSSFDISSLPNLRLITIICLVLDEDFETSMNYLITALKSAMPTRGESSSGTPVSLLERVMVEFHYDFEEPKIPKRLLEIADEWPVVVFHTRSLRSKVLTPL